jgi:2-oxoglutarate/2-oxoacid ferredoxin oxidoreductase subunit beta
MLRAAALHEGSALVEIYQNCPVFNDGAFDALRDKKQFGINAIQLEHGQPITFNGGTQQVVRDAATGDLRIAEAGDGEPLVHDAHRDDPSLAFALSRLAMVPNGPTPIGIFRSVERPVYDALMEQQLEDARKDKGEGDLEALLHAGDTWTIR